MRGIEQSKIVIFDSRFSDVGDICVYHIPESFPIETGGEVKHVAHGRHGAHLP